jgi:hypothetical protein
MIKELWRRMNATGLDRTILRAFYTQYVAVLLIVLVFFVAAFQRSQPVSRVVDSFHAPIAQELSIIHPFEVSAFSEDGSILSNEPALVAVAEVLRHHDLRVECSVFLPHHDFDATQGELREALHRARLLGDFFRQRGIPGQAVRVVVEESAVNSPRTVRVRMKSEEVLHGVS